MERTESDSGLPIGGATRRHTLCPCSAGPLPQLSRPENRVRRGARHEEGPSSLRSA